MGELDVHRLDAAGLKHFARALIRDVEALEELLRAGAIQSGHRRVGCEQEMFLIDSSGRAKPVALELLQAIDDPHFTTELGLFNLEVNQDSLVFERDCLSRMERDLVRSLDQVRTAAALLGTDIVLTGILPTLRKSDLTAANLTPLPRYSALNNAMRDLGGGRYQFRLQGIDELIVMQDSVMLEACCTSFQIHYQTDPEDFVNVYNLAQVVTAPLLAAAVNSPLLFGRRLWHETRIPLFQQSIDTRRAGGSLRERAPRVTFGEKWLEGSVVELFRDEIARLPIILGTHVELDSLDQIRQGQMPLLRALQVHNGTVYRWNRPCYGVSDGVAHLRIENRVIPAGPTVPDQIANAAFFFGLLHAMPRVYPDVTRVMEFEHSLVNFLSAARYGLESQFRWIGGVSVGARDLILEELLPLARTGLAEAGLLPADIERYLGLIHDRVSSGRTGAVWTLESLASMREAGRETAMAALTSSILQHQWGHVPVHEWPLARLDHARFASDDAVRVEEAMSTNLFTVRPEEPVELALALMEWRKIRHVPVEDDAGCLKGILSLAALRALGLDGKSLAAESISAGDVMEPSPHVIGPERSLGAAAAEMIREGVDYLVVVEDERIAGILTELDILRVAPALLRSRAPEDGR